MNNRRFLSSAKAKTLLAIIIPAIVAGLLFYQFRIADDKWKEVISSDGLGYYHYLVEYLVDDHFRNFEKEQQYLSEADGKFYTKYPFGTAFCLAPFFVAGQIHAAISGATLNGFSFPFQLWIGIGALFWLFTGAVGLFYLLRSYRISKTYAYFTVLVIISGTNLLLYGVVASTMSHVYSFAAICWFALFIRKSFITGKSRYLFGSVFFLTMIFFIRPFNLLILLAVPALVAELHEPLKKLKGFFFRPKPLATGLMLAVGLLILQLLSWYDQSGSWLLFSYQDEGFYFLKPKIAAVLLSFNKGLFVYTPLILVALIGLMLWQKSRKNALLFFLFFFILIYFIASWWCWNYASGYGLRPFIDYYGIFAVPLAVALQNSSKHIRIILFVLIIGCVSLNLIQSFQYARLIMSHSSMNWSKYKYIFLKTGEEYINSLGGNFDVPPYAPEGLTLVHAYSTADTISISREFSQTFEISGNLITGTPYALYATIEFKKAEIHPMQQDVLFVIDVKSDGQSLYYDTFAIDDLPVKTGHWTKAAHSVTFPAPKENEKVKIYLWNRDQAKFMLSDYKVKVFEPRP